jgi:hypothetical protein
MENVETDEVKNKKNAFYVRWSMLGVNFHLDGVLREAKITQ